MALSTTRQLSPMALPRQTPLEAGAHRKVPKPEISLPTTRVCFDLITHRPWGHKVKAHVIFVGTSGFSRLFPSFFPPPCPYLVHLRFTFPSVSQLPSQAHQQEGRACLYFPLSHSFQKQARRHPGPDSRHFPFPPRAPGEAALPRLQAAVCLSPLPGQVGQDGPGQGQGDWMQRERRRRSGAAVLGEAETRRWLGEQSQAGLSEGFSLLQVGAGTKNPLFVEEQREPQDCTSSCQLSASAKSRDSRDENWERRGQGKYESLPKKKKRLKYLF
ncbi:uncharacterized protein LOC114024386 [Vombatus ursinus]|uniref:uncharacterized protein LOC114024386 n=1 Tax=Vombatus ursinus TaxID=29139 RepID=UPI000FFD1D94|nr:uncharacterized protein LOC114024386 [Vombatus ursinus]